MGVVLGCPRATAEHFTMGAGISRPLFCCARQGAPARSERPLQVMPLDSCHCLHNFDHSKVHHEPPYTELYVRWCERRGEATPLLLDASNSPGTRATTSVDVQAEASLFNRAASPSLPPNIPGCRFPSGGCLDGRGPDILAVEIT